MSKYPQVCAGIAALVISAPSVFAVDPATNTMSSSGNATTDSSTSTGSPPQSGLLEGRRQRRQQRWERRVDFLKGTNPPSPKEVLSLSTLTPDQRKAIQAIYQGCPERPLRKQIWELRHQQQTSSTSQGTDTSSSKTSNTGSNGNAGSTGSNGTPNPLDAHKKMRELRQQLRVQRLKTWERVKAKLTPDQIKQAQQLHSQAKQMYGNSTHASGSATTNTSN